MTRIEAIFEFLFKYRPSVFRQGELALAAPWSLLIGVLLVGAGLVVALTWLAGKRHVGGKSRPWDRALLLGLRIAVVALVVTCLLQPTLVLSVVVPLQSFVGVVVDDSKSMRIPDQGDEPRGDVIYGALDAENGTLFEALSERFKVRMFGFSRDTRRIDDVTQLRFAGSETHLGVALQGAVEELSAVPLAGLILLSDGADNSNATLEDTLLELRARSVPVFTVGLGRERFPKDIEVSRVSAPRAVLKGSSLVVEVTLNQTGYSGTDVQLDVEDSGRIINSEAVRFPTSGEAATVQVHLTASQAGPRVFRFRVPPRPGELVSQNNEQLALLNVVDRREKILYFEGEPRYELKFLRRAVADDENLQLVCLQRTAENKFLRLDVDTGEELQGGFPTSREELFGYRGLVLGSIEASFFTYDQMRMMVDFTSQRGGGFMMLGGRSAFAEGGYAGTPVDDLLPVVLGPTRGGGEGEVEPFFSELKVGLTPYGRSHPALRLGGPESELAERWEDLPPLSTFNPLTRLKPGATSLLLGKGDRIRGEQVVLAHQRYGRGRALAFTAHDSWMWQMTLELEDMTHETLWRQLLRWLVSYVPDQLVVRSNRDRVAPGEEVEVTAEVRDDTYLAVNSAEVTAEVRGPGGATRHLPMEWTVEKDGQYRASFVAREAGRYQIQVAAHNRDGDLGTATAYVDAAELATEYFDAEKRTSLLKRIAQETGGRYYTPEQMDYLAEDLSYAEGGSTVLEHKDLWDMPVVFIALVLLLATEWIYRKARGLV